MVQELIKPTQQMASHFVAAIISFLRSSFGEEKYSSLRIGDPTKKIGADYGSVQLSSLSPDKEITSLWNFLQENDAGLEVKNITPGGSYEKITAIKISLDLPKEFLLGYGNDQVKQFCKDFDSEDEQSQNHSNDTSGQGGVNPVDSQPNSGGEDEGIIKTVEDLREAVSDVSDSRSKSRTVSTFFKWYLEQNGITEYEVLPRTAYKYQGEEPEFAVRILDAEKISKVLEEFRSQGCDVDIAGREKNVVRVKAFVIDPDSLSKNGSQGNRQQSSDSKKPTTKKKVIKKKMTKKVGKKFQPKVKTTKSDVKLKKSSKLITKLVSKKSAKVATKVASKTKSKVAASAAQQKLFIDVFMEDFSQFVRDFLKKPTERNFGKFREVVLLKQKELEILKDIQTNFLNLLKLREKSKF